MALIATDKPRVIVGLGVTGLSCARYLRKQGVPFVIADSREAPPNVAALRAEMPEVTLHLGAFDAELFKRAGELIVSPGIALEEPAIVAAKAAGVGICGDIDLFVRANAQSPTPAPIVAITGSNGKSTVTTLVGDMAAAAGKVVGVGGNLGTAALDLLDDAVELYVLELSSFQLERAEPLHPLVATVLNISPDHQDRHPTLVSYHQAKHRIFRGAQQAVVNRADPLSRPLVPDAAPKWSFGLDAPDFKGFGVREHIDTSGGAGAKEMYLAFERELLMPVRELKIVGNHNIANALAALALGHAAGLPMPVMLQTLREFPGLPHRCQLVAQNGKGVRYFNDSKGTNVGATVAAIEGLCAQPADRVVLIAGGVGKGQEFYALVPVLQRCGRGVVLIGEAANDIAAALGASVPQVRADSMPAAVAAATAMAQAGDSVLLSPACASFDMFDNYAHRGDMFVAAVNNLVGANS
jgi:UDP-N-acetylmuramoylalanine--D-glutamate ligase